MNDLKDEMMRIKSQALIADEIINEVEKLIERSETDCDRIAALLYKASAVAAINPSRGFETVNTAIEIINQNYPAKSEPGRRESILESPAFDENLGVLSRADFQRALNLALSINQNGTSVMAQLAICRGVLIAPK
jgi:hypothetical protein